MAVAVVDSSVTPVDRREFERIRDVLASADVEGPLTASEIVDALEANDVSVESAHRVATVLGRRADTDAVEVVGEEPPYRYRVRDA